MFFGETAISIDDKGRCAIPTVYRESLAVLCQSRLVVAYNPFERECLWLFPRPEWERVRDQVMSLPSLLPAHRELQRKLVGAAAQLELDANGRLVLPPTQRQGAGLSRSAVLLGMGMKFELWSEAAHQARVEQPIDVGSLTDDMRSLSF